MEKILARKTVYQGRVVSVEEATIDFGKGEASIFEQVVFNVETGVSALPIDAKQRVYLVEHFQLAAGKRILTLPTGGLGKDEDPAERMQLELQEEIGYKAGSLTKMFSAHAIPGYVGSKPMSMYLATDLVPSKLVGDEIEELVVHKLPLDEVVQMVKSNKIVDSRVIIAVLYYVQFFR